jgi:hypothetical protein
MFIESCMYTSVLGKINKLQKKSCKYYTITTLERDQYEVSWSRVQQY